MFGPPAVLDGPSSQTSYEGTEPQGVFPQTATFRSSTPDAVLDRLLLPGCHFGAGIATRIRRTIHQGIIGIYLLYTALILCLLLVISIFAK